MWDDGVLSVFDKCPVGIATYLKSFADVLFFFPSAMVFQCVVGLKQKVLVCVSGFPVHLHIGVALSCGTGSRGLDPFPAIYRQKGIHPGQGASPLHGQSGSFINIYLNEILGPLLAQNQLFHSDFKPVYLLIFGSLKGDFAAVFLQV